MPAHKKSFLVVSEQIDRLPNGGNRENDAISWSYSSQKL